MDREMTTGEMHGYQKRLLDIQNGSDVNRDIRLTHLMTDLEQAFHIPMIRKDSFIEANPHLMQMYMTVSMERSI